MRSVQRDLARRSARKPGLGKARCPGGRPAGEGGGFDREGKEDARRAPRVYVHATSRPAGARPERPRGAERRGEQAPFAAASCLGFFLQETGRDETGKRCGGG